MENKGIFTSINYENGICTFSSPALDISLTCKKEDHDALAGYGLIDYEKDGNVYQLVSAERISMFGVDVVNEYANFYDEGANNCSFAHYSWDLYYRQNVRSVKTFFCPPDVIEKLMQYPQGEKLKLSYYKTFNDQTAIYEVRRDDGSISGPKEIRDWEGMYKGFSGNTCHFTYGKENYPLNVHCTSEQRNGLESYKNRPIVFSYSLFFDMYVDNYGWHIEFLDFVTQPTAESHIIQSTAYFLYNEDNKCIFSELKDSEFVRSSLYCSEKQAQNLKNNAYTSYVSLEHYVDAQGIDVLLDFEEIPRKMPEGVELFFAEASFDGTKEGPNCYMRVFDNDYNVLDVIVLRCDSIDRELLEILTHESYLRLFYSYYKNEDGENILYALYETETDYYDAQYSYEEHDEYCEYCEDGDLDNRFVLWGVGTSEKDACLSFRSMDSGEIITLNCTNEYQQKEAIENRWMYFALEHNGGNLLNATPVDEIPRYYSELLAIQDNGICSFRVKDEHSHEKIDDVELICGTPEFKDSIQDNMEESETYYITYTCFGSTCYLLASHDLG